MVDDIILNDGDHTTESVAVKPLSVKVVDWPEHIETPPDPVTVGFLVTNKYIVSVGLRPQQSVVKFKVIGKRPGVLNCRCRK